MNKLLFHEFLLNNKTINFVDYLLTSIKKWREVYKYNNEGNIAGWYRYNGKSITEYTLDGKIIIEKDKEGSVLKAQDVKYVYNKKLNILKVFTINKVFKY